MKSKDDLKCSLVQPQINSLFTGNLDAKFTRQLKAHLRQCKSCHNAFVNAMAGGIFQAQVAFRQITDKTPEFELPESTTNLDITQSVPPALLVEEVPTRLAAASLSDKTDHQVESGVKLFTFERVSLKLQSNLENEEETLLTLEVRPKFRKILENKKVKITTKDNDFLLEDIIRSGKASGIVKYCISAIKESPRIFYP